jgi:hypothetical protein
MTKLSLYNIELRLQKLDDLAFETMDQLKEINDRLPKKKQSNQNLDLSDSVGSLNNPLLSRGSVQRQQNSCPTRMASINRFNIKRKRTLTICTDNVTQPNQYDLQLNNNDISKKLSEEDAARSERIQNESFSSTPKTTNIYDGLIDSDLQFDFPLNDVQDDNDSNKNVINTKQKETKYSLLRKQSNLDSQIDHNQVTIPMENYQIDEKEEEDQFNIKETDPLYISNQTQRKSNLQTVKNDQIDYNDEKILSKVYETDEDYDLEIDPKMNSNPPSANILDDFNSTSSFNPIFQLNTNNMKPITLMEYTSITDTIDTTNVDRPPSPQLILPFQYSTSKSTEDNLPENTDNIKKNRNASIRKNVHKDYSALETARNAVVRQETQILRMAEESQHAIISQMFNKIEEPKESDNNTGNNITN